VAAKEATMKTLTKKEGHGGHTRVIFIAKIEKLPK
jgi:hypothetical protein